MCAPGVEKRKCIIISEGPLHISYVALCNQLFNKEYYVDTQGEQNETKLNTDVQLQANTHSFHTEAKNKDKNGNT